MLRSINDNYADGRKIFQVLSDGWNQKKFPCVKRGIAASLCVPMLSFDYASAQTVDRDKFQDFIASPLHRVLLGGL